MHRYLSNTLRALALTCLAAGPVWADNDNNPATESIPRVVPYDGVLDLDGSSFNGTVDVIFTLYDAASGGNAVWTEAWSTAEERAVSVTGGRFSVNLGTYESIETVIVDAGQVYLGMQIKQPESEEYATLGGRQRINPVPYAMWSATAADLTVSGAATVGDDLTVGGNITVSGRINVGNRVYIDRQLNVTGWTNLGNDLRVLNDDGGYSAALSVDSSWLELGTSGAWANGIKMPPPVRMNDTLTVVGRSYFSSKMDISADLEVDNDLLVRDTATFQETVSVGTDLTVGDDATITDDLSVGGDLTVSGDLNKTLIYARKYEMGNDTSLTTTISTANWFCTIGSIDFDDGNIQENNDGNIIQVHTRDVNGVWVITADFRSHNDHEDHTVGLVCYRRSIVNEHSWFDDDD